jgi:hypothetical protein
MHGSTLVYIHELAVRARQLDSVAGLKISVGHGHCPTLREIVRRKEETIGHSVRPK